MFQHSFQSASTTFTPTDKVVARLRSEGWVDCWSLDFPALSQLPISDIRSFIITQLNLAGGQMQKTDLELTALIFSVPSHQFEVHPHLRFVLKTLEADGVIECRRSQQNTIAVVLSP